MTQVTSQLAKDTKVFWNISKVFHGRSNTKTTTESAIKQLGKINSSLGEHRVLSIHVISLLDQIIYSERPNSRRTSKSTKPLKEVVEK